MWFDTNPNARWADACKHLAKRDPVMRKLIQRVGECTLRPRRDYFVKLVQSILSQQVSVKAAASMYAKLALNFEGKKPTPDAVVRFLEDSDDDVIRACGLSRQKRAYVYDLAQRFADGSIPHKRFARMSDEELIESLTQVKGIGRWTVEMLLIFALNRTDVWPVDDLGLREGIRREYGQPERRPAKELIDFADHLKPYRSIATWYLWRGGAVK